MGLIYLKKDDIDTAEKLGNQSLKIAQSIKDKLQIFTLIFYSFLQRIREGVLVCHSGGKPIRY